MDTHKRQRKGIFRESLAVVMVLYFLVPGLTAGERKGHGVIVTRTDSTVVAGELLAVKKIDLLIMERSTNNEITVSLADVRDVKVVKKSKFLKGAGIGFLIGTSVGAFLGVASSGQSGAFSYNAGEGALLSGAVFGVTGMLVGGIAGALSSKYRDFQVHPGSQAGLLAVASRLQRYARARY